MLDKIKRHTLGTLPSVVEIGIPVSVPTPSIPTWLKVVLCVLGAGIIVMGWITFNGIKRKKKNAQEIVALNEKNAQQSQVIADYKEKYKQ